MRADYSLTIDGVPVAKAFGPVLESLSITDSDGGKSDTLDIMLSDVGGRILLPRVGASIQAAIWWAEVPGFSVPGAVTFSGKTDEPKSTGGRGHGRGLSISAKSADHVGKGKAKLNRHKDKAKFGDVAQEWGKIAGYQVKVHADLASVQRDYWSMANESFHNWGRRVAAELGATFKCAHPQAVFVPRNAGVSASGKALAALEIVAPGNLISWDIAPILGRGVYANSRASWYDSKAGLWRVEQAPTGMASGEADLTDAHHHANKDRAQSRAKSNADDCARKGGAGMIELYGDPRAMSQNNCSLSGARVGVDGSYRVKTAHHTYSRGGWHCSVDVEQPQGAAGKDTRK